MANKKIRGGSLIARAIRDKGIDKVFTLSGGFCNPALEGFMDYLLSNKPNPDDDEFIN